jgi:hypothetical protein
MRQIVNSPQRRGKLVGVVRRRIFQLLEQAVDGGANFRRIRRIGLLAVGDAFLAKQFSTYIAAHPVELREVQDPRRQLTGRPNGPAVRSLSPAQWVAERVAISEELLWHKTCSQCHAITATTLQDVKIARWDAANSQPPANSSSTGSGADAARAATSLPEIARANVTLQWMTHARFDHDAHRGFSCAGCHPKRK